MSAFREIAPAPLGGDHPTSSQGNDRPSKPKNNRRGEKRKRHDEETWTELRDAIVQTYADHALNDTIRIIKETCGFEASTRCYKEKLKDWGVEKNFPKNVLQFVAEKHRQRLQDGIKTVSFFKGIQLDDEAIRKFQTRQQYPSQAAATSPPKVTPQDVEYFTPLTPDSFSGGHNSTPQVFTPISKLSAFAVNNYESLKNDPLALSLLRHDAAVRKIRLIEALRDGKAHRKLYRAERREKAHTSHVGDQATYQIRRRRQKALASGHTPSTQKHAHYEAHINAAGNGRFEREHLLKTLLWSSQNLANEILGWMHRKKANEDDVVLTLPSDLRGKPSECPEFFLSASSEHSPNALVEPLLALLRHNKLLQRTLGLSQQDIRRWIGPWARMNDDTAQLLHRTAKCLLGDPTISFPHGQRFSILVHFKAAMPTGSPVLLRIFFGSNINVSPTKCSQCESHPMVLDYISGYGMLKIQVAAASACHGQIWTSLEDLLNQYRLESTVFFSKWSPTAYQSRGVQFTRHVRQCYCNGAVHQGGFKPHFIDLQREHDARNEQWSPLPDIQTGEEFFQAIPGDGEDGHGLLTVENLDVFDCESEEEHWDPLGQESSNREHENFELHPSDDEEEQQYVSKPIF